jgi:nucleotide-binding universal stress UspA family protein
MTSRVLLAVDGSIYSRVAVDDLIAHVKPESAVVHVLHAIELEDLVPVADDFARGGQYGPDVMAHVGHGRDEAAHLVADAAGRLAAAGFSVATAVREGDPRRAILDYAAEHKCDWIVMGSHGRRGLERFLMGSVSEAVARHARCSVLIVRVHRD